MGLEIVERCPICSGTLFHHYLTCKDYTTSQENFTILQCNSCSLLVTSPRPDDQSVGQYYDSAQYISHTGGGEGLSDRIYLLARHYTLKWKLKHINSARTSEGRTILDYGCGTGEFLKTCAGNGWSIAGIEPSEKARKKAAQLTKISIPASLADIQPHAKFDIITLWHVLEHVYDLNKVVAGIKDRLQPGGTIFIAVPNFESYDSSFYKEYWAGYDVPRHVWHFSAAAMNLLVKRHGMHIRETIPMKQDAYYVSLLSEKYKHPGRNFMISGLAAFMRGFHSNRKAKKNRQYSSLVYRIEE